MTPVTAGSPSLYAIILAAYSIVTGRKALSDSEAYAGKASRTFYASGVVMLLVGSLSLATAGVVTMSVVQKAAMVTVAAAFVCLVASGYGERKHDPIGGDTLPGEEVEDGS